MRYKSLLLLAFIFAFEWALTMSFAYYWQQLLSQRVSIASWGFILLGSLFIGIVLLIFAFPPLLTRFFHYLMDFQVHVNDTALVRYLIQAGPVLPFIYWVMVKVPLT